MSAYGVGAIIVGMLITPTVSQRFGRKLCIQLGCAIVIVSAIVQCFAPNMEAFIAGRLIMGMGQGLAVSTGPTYVAEVVSIFEPVANRDPADLAGTFRDSRSHDVVLAKWVTCRPQLTCSRLWYRS
jgi:MFS family permease